MTFIAPPIAVAFKLVYGPAGDHKYEACHVATKASRRFHARRYVESRRPSRPRSPGQPRRVGADLPLVHGLARPQHAPARRHGGWCLIAVEGVRDRAAEPARR